MTGRLERYRELFFTSSSTERTVFFSDAVFAIAMTLLVLEIKIPTAEELSGGSLLHELGNIWFEFFAYALSFFFIASTWMSHHHIWRFVTHVTAPAQWINMALLFFVAFTPVPTAVVASYGPATPTSPVFYALTITAVGLSLLGLLGYCHRHGMVSDEVTPDMYVMIRRQLILSPVVFVASCVVAIAWGPIFRPFAPGAADYGPLIAMLSWSSLTPAFAISNRQMRGWLRRLDEKEAATADQS